MKGEGKLLGSKAIVTGAAQGIGQAIARTLSREGATVAIADINLQSAKQGASEIEHLGGSALAIKVDVTRQREVTEMVRALLDRWGAIDILVNNAGGFTRSFLIHEGTEEEWDRLINLNLKSVFLCCRAVAKPMMERRKGRIINIASLAALGPNPHALPCSPYGAAKAGVVGFTKHLAQELGPYGITVNAISPGAVLTPRVQEMTDANSLKKITEVIPLGRMVEARDCGEAVLFLVSEGGGSITGVNLNVNAGAMMI